MHDILELQFGSNPPTPAKSAVGTPSQGPTTAAKSATAAPSQGPKKLYTRYNVNSPQGMVMLEKVLARDRDHAGAAATRSAFMAVVVEYSLAQRLSGVPVGLLDEAENGRDAHRFRRRLARMRRPCGTAASPTPPTPLTLSTFNSGTSCRGIG